MRKATWRVVGALALSLAAAYNPASAVVITFPQPAPVLMNFDLTGALPGPLFDSIELTIPRDVVAAMGCQVFADLMNSPADLATAQFVNGCASSVTVTYTYTNVEMLDGEFSIGFGLNPSVVTDPFAVGIRNGARTADVLGTLVPGQTLVGQVSEPGSLSLIALALLAALRRRRCRPPSGALAPSPRV